MDKYEEIVSNLKAVGIKFDTALYSEEIGVIEKKYDLIFPIPLRRLFSIGLPISKGFYNWRDTASDNVQNIKEALNAPMEDLKAEIKEGFWADEWGRKPNDDSKAETIFLAHYNSAPKLIPLYAHRYMPYIQDVEDVPVLSVMGSDIIYYGKDLISYLQIEFKFKEYDKDINCKYVSFWSDLL